MRIGISLSESKTQFYVNQAYVAYLRTAGFEPVIISTLNEVEAYVEFCDALLLPGGIDLDPNFYGEDNVASYKVDPMKDDFERQLLHAFIGVGKRVFGICRGFQLIMREYLRENPQMDSSIGYWQHINGHDQVGTLSLDRNVTSHRVSVLPSGLYGQNDDITRSMYVNSMHHQGVMAVPPSKKPNATRFGNLQVVASSRHGMKAKDKGYIIEGVRVLWHTAELLAVQWHPEELVDVSLIQNFFNQGEVMQTAGE